jgi:hypothetical protein
MDYRLYFGEQAAEVNSRARSITTLLL